MRVQMISGLSLEEVEKSGLIFLLLIVQSRQVLNISDCCAFKALVLVGMFPGVCQG